MIEITPEQYVPIYFVISLIVYWIGYRDSNKRSPYIRTDIRAKALVYGVFWLPAVMLVILVLCVECMNKLCDIVLIEEKEK